MIDLSPLDRFAFEQRPFLPGFTGPEAKCGKRGPCTFIYTIDHDGQIELSLSVGKFKKPTDAQVEAFFRYLGVAPVVEEYSDTIRHFVLKIGGPMQ